MTNLNPKVSVVITTKNEEKNIGRCLMSVKHQTYPSIEIIVVDNQSSDRTQEIARQYTDQVHTQGPERSTQRNFGMIDVAQGEYVMFLDADMILSPTLVAECVHQLKSHSGMQPGSAEPGAVALHIPEIILGKRFFSRVRRFERSFYDGTVVDGARFFIRKVFIEVGGFDEKLCGPEDWDIDKKIKKVGKILLLNPRGRAEPESLWNPELLSFLQGAGVSPLEQGPGIYHNEAELELSRYLSKKAYYTQSFQAYVDKWGPQDPDIRRQLGAGYRLLGVFVERGKFTRLLTRPHLAGGMMFLRFLVGYEFLKSKLRRS